MLKYYAALVAISLLPVCIQAQNNFPPTGNVSIGAASPQFSLHISTGTTTGLGVQNTAAFSGNSGAFLRLYNSGTPNAVNQRLGGLLIGNSPTSATFATGVQIDAITDSAWTDAVSLPASLRFLTIPRGTTALTERMRITAAGNVGIGIATPAEKLTVNGNILVGRDNYFGTALTDRFTYDGKSQPHYGMQWVMDSWSAAGPTFWAAAFGGMKFLTQGVARVAITGDGNVGIGTITPQAKFAVNGDIFAKKIKVTQTGWPDYVFEEDYQLPSLAEVAAYVKTNKHLPDMPSAAEVEKEGLDLGEMNKQLLQKVEELTLYMIELKQENIRQQKQIQVLENRFASTSPDNKNSISDLLSEKLHVCIKK